MLTEELKQRIQQAYRDFLAGKGLQPRYGQKLMIAEIARTLGAVELDDQGVRSSDGHICVVEAGTGTGKTVAYLLATLPVAKALGKKVVLATATVALQEQVIYKDLPDLINFSKLQCSFTLAKGRGRYLCLSKLDRIVSELDTAQIIPLYEDEITQISEKELRLFRSMMVSLSHGEWDGDRDSWADELEQTTWQRVTTDHHQCTGRRCSHVRQCAFYRAREQLEDVDCIVANHDLVLADLALGGGTILPAPQDTIYIFDEGHHLPDKALNHFALHTRYKSTIRWLGQSEGQWNTLLAPLAEATYLKQLAEPVEGLFKQARTVLETNLPLIQSLFDSHVSDTRFANQSTRRARFMHGRVPLELEQVAQQIAEAFTDLATHLIKPYQEVEHLLEADFVSVPKVDLENLYPVVGSWLARVEANLALWDSFSATENQEDWPVARWITAVELGDYVDYEFVSSPILASRTLEQDLWSQCCGAVLTSATMTALNSFERFIYRSGTYSDASYAVVPSPFNFADNATLEVPSFAIEANNAPLHTENLIDNLPKLIDVKAGSLVLFASRRQMLDVYDQLPTHTRNIILLQGSETKQRLINKHKQRIDEGNGSALFGLASFMEGLDLPGPYCTHVIVAKIPFAVPDDPIEAALAEWVETNGGNAFLQITVPDAAMRLVQACGRLLRTETDCGKVTIMDRRLVSKAYGKTLLDSLPPFKRKIE